MTNPIARPLRTMLVAAPIVCFAGGAGAEGKDAVVDRPSSPRQLGALVPVPLASRPLVTVYEVTSSVAEIEPRAATTMFTTALIKSRSFRVFERSRLAESITKERELNSTGSTTGAAGAKKLTGANVVFEATFSEASMGNATTANEFSLGGLSVGGAGNKDEIGLDVRVLSVGTGEVFDAVNVRKQVASSESRLSGVGNLLGTLASARGVDLRGLAPDANIRSARKEGMDRALRALIELAVAELAKRAAEWPED